MPPETKPKTSRRSVVRRKLNAQLEAHLRINGIGPSNGPSTSSVHPSLPKRPVAPCTQVDSMNATSSVSVLEHSPPAGNGVQADSVPPSPEHYQHEEMDIGGSSTCDSVGTSQAALGAPGNTAPQERIQPDPLDRSEDGDGTPIHLPDLQTTQQFIDMLRVAVLEDSGMCPEDIENIRNPGHQPELADPSPLLRSIRHFINNASASRDHYDTTREIELLNNPADEFLSFDQVKRRVRWLSGVVPLQHDMCIRSCVAYTGPYGELDSCPRCGSPRYILGTTTPQKQFSTIPIGPVVQALYGSREVAECMHYLETKLAENLRIARANSGKLITYDDTPCGQELLDAWGEGRFKASDIALQLSIDGAQLCPDQPSEAWVFIWVFHNLPPDMRYKKAFVIPGAIVPGPYKPADMDSFLFPSFYHIAALQREGLRIYDASLDRLTTCSRPLILFGTADSPGSTSMSGMVGHSGRYGCRLYCDMPGRRRFGDSHYYPAMKVPLDYDIVGCCHPDVTDADLSVYRSDLPHKYSRNLSYLLEAKTLAEYRTRRLEVGLCKQTLFSGLPYQPISVPSVFTMDIMHLTVLNEPDLFLKLFTGKLDVGDSDDRETWDWAVFYKNTPLWNMHGDTVARTVPYIPSSFGRALRDPSKKINSGYKAWEYQQYFYGLGPTLFRHILPRKYWLNFCKLVSGVRILQHHSITFEDVLKGHRLLTAFIAEFEDLYYQRMEARIHFVRHSIHMLTHIAPETIRAGPLTCYAQWTLETAIGNLGREIRQDRDLYANLTQRAILRAQVNSLQARFPRIRLEIRGRHGMSLPRGACEFEGCKGYTLLPRCEEYPTPLSEDELVALMSYWNRQGWPNQDSWSKTICRWAKLRLPNGQMACSVWKESRTLSNVRRASCVEVRSTLFFLPSHTEKNM